MALDRSGAVGVAVGVLAQPRQGTAHLGEVVGPQQVGPFPFDLGADAGAFLDERAAGRGDRHQAGAGVPDVFVGQADVG